MNKATRPRRPTRAARVLAVVMLIVVPLTGLSSAGRDSFTYNAQENSAANTMGKPYAFGSRSEFICFM